MKRSTRTFGDRVLRSGKRFFTTRSQDEAKRVRFTSSDVDVVSIQQTKKKKILDHCLEIKDEKNTQEIEFEYVGVLGINDQIKQKDLNFGEFGIDKGILGINNKSQEVENFEKDKGILGINDKSQKVENFGDFKKMSENVDSCDNVSGFKRFGCVYTRKRKRNIGRKGQYNVVENYSRNDHGKGLLVHLVADEFVVFRKSRSVRRRVPRVPRVLCYNELTKKIEGKINGSVPAPGVREVEGYAEQEFVPFVLPESYITSRGDEVSRVLEKGYGVYDMDCDDEKWLETFNSERFGGDGRCVAEDTFERVIDVFERGNYCNPNEYSDAASAVERCRGEVASKEVLEALYRYWRNKRKRKRSPLIRVFQCYDRPIVKRRVANAAQKRLVRRPASKRCAEKEFNLKEAMLNNQKVWEVVANMYMKVHETREAAKRSEETAIVKRQQAQALMELADLATYRAFNALRIAEALAASTSVTDTTGAATFGPLDE